MKVMSLNEVLLFSVAIQDTGCSYDYLYYKEWGGLP